MKLSKRLLTIADLIDTKNVIDVGCDHALLDIYLTQEKQLNCRGTDISSKVLENAKNNVKKYNLEKKIPLILTNGLENIKIKKDDTIIIAGMGASTILEILNNYKNNNQLIISSNNEIERIRKEITKKNYFIKEEKVVFEKKHCYVIIKFKKGNKKYTKWDYLLGPKTKKEKKYLEFLYQKYDKISKKLPNKYIFKKFKLFIIKTRIKKILNSK